MKNRLDKNGKLKYINDFSIIIMIVVAIIIIILSIMYLSGDYNRIINSLSVDR